MRARPVTTFACYARRAVPGCCRCEAAVFFLFFQSAETALCLARRPELQNTTSEQGRAVRLLLGRVVVLVVVRRRLWRPSRGRPVWTVSRLWLWPSVCGGGSPSGMHQTEAARCVTGAVQRAPGDGGRWAVRVETVGVRCGNQPPGPRPPQRRRASKAISRLIYWPAGFDTRGTDGPGGAAWGRRLLGMLSGANAASQTSEARGRQAVSWWYGQRRDERHMADNCQCARKGCCCGMVVVVVESVRSTYLPALGRYLATSADTQVPPERTGRRSIPAPSSPELKLSRWASAVSRDPGASASC